jgi:hypothetical protein
METKGSAGKIVGVIILEDSDVVDHSRADFIMDSVSTIKPMTLERLWTEYQHKLLIAVSPRYAEQQRVANPPKSRNKREGKYSFPEKHHGPNEPVQYSLVWTHRKRGLNSRRITAQRYKKLCGNTAPL